MLFSPLFDCCCFSSLLYPNASSLVECLYPFRLLLGRLLPLPGAFSAGLPPVAVKSLPQNRYYSSKPLTPQRRPEGCNPVSQYICRDRTDTHTGASRAALNATRQCAQSSANSAHLCGYHTCEGHSPHSETDSNPVQSSTYMKYIQFVVHFESQIIEIGCVKNNP